MGLSRLPSPCFPETPDGPPSSWSGQRNGVADRSDGMERRRWGFLLALLLLIVSAPTVGAQYEKYSFRGFPEAELMPLQSAYAYALEQYEGENWRESIRYLEASLRLHRLLQDSEAHCHKECAGSEKLDTGPLFTELAKGAWNSPSPSELLLKGGSLAGLEGSAGCSVNASGITPGEGLQDQEMEYFGLVLQRASCLRRCKGNLPVFQLTYPPTETLRDFQRRTPYQYLHYALFKVSVGLGGERGSFVPEALYH